MRRWTRTAPLVLLTLFACDTQGPFCHKAYAPSGVSVHLDTTSWPDGEPRVVFDLDGAEVPCAIEAPADTDGTSEALWWTCGDAPDRRTRDRAVVEFFFEAHTPEEVLVTVFVDDVEFGTEAASPTYEVDEPNGEGCGERTAGEVHL